VTGRARTVRTPVRTPASETVRFAGCFESRWGQCDPRGQAKTRWIVGSGVAAVAPMAGVFPHRSPIALEAWMRCAAGVAGADGFLYELAESEVCRLLPLRTRPARGRVQRARLTISTSASRNGSSIGDPWSVATFRQASRSRLCGESCSEKVRGRTCRR
jgi:hypothetical protein